MSGRAGVYSQVKKRYQLADAGRQVGALVLVLECGHAVTSNKSSARRRAWCRLCSASRQSGAEKVTTTRAQFEAAVAREVAKALKKVRPLEMRPGPTDEEKVAMLAAEGREIGGAE